MLRALIAAGALALIVPVSLAARAKRPDASTAQANVTVTEGASTQTVPRSFFGLSVEYPELPTYEKLLTTFENVLSLVHVVDTGPLVLRIGGDTADQTYWNPGSRQLPPFSFVLTPGWFQQTRMLVSQLGLRVILDVNLKAHSPSMAASLARAALARLPAGSIAGFEVGNEPDLYGHGYTVSDYERDFRAYARALKQVAPNVPVMGPAITATDDSYKWLAGVMAHDLPQLGTLTGHRYPLTPCRRPDNPLYPTIAKLLSENTSAGMAKTVSPAVRLAHRGKRQFRLDELNSVTCGGLVGVSNSFATALWAPDALFELVRTGLDGLDMHIRPTKINGPLDVTQSGMTARPLLYGMILFARTLGPGGRLVQLNLHEPSSVHVKAWGVRVSGNMTHVLLINKGSSPANVELHLPATADAVVERLLAPSVSATAGVTLAGRQLGTDGSFIGQPVGQVAHHTPSGYHVTVPGVSAALLIVRLTSSQASRKLRAVRHSRP